MTDDTEKQQQLQQKYMEYQMLEQQIKQMQEHAQKLEQQTAEIHAVKQSLEDMEKSEAGKEVLVPVSGGIFFRAELKDGKNFLVNVGSGVVVEKDAASTRELIENQEKEMERFKDQLMEQLVESMIRHNSMEEELKKLIE